MGTGALLTKETFGKLEAINKVTGVQIEGVIKGFADAGMSAYEASDKMQGVVKIARNIGVDAGKVSQMVITNLSETSKFNFQGGVEGMAKMAAQAVNLRIDMDSTLRLAQKLFDPEQAINLAAAMQRLGVQQSALLDPLRLMDLAQNDPTELQNQIAEMSKEFVKMNERGQFEIMPGAKRQLMEIERELQLPIGQLSKMALAGAELEDKLSKIKMPDTFTDEQKKFIANMAQMGKGGEYMLKVDGKELGIDKAMSVFAEDKDALEKFMKASEEKSMEQLANEQLTIQKRMANSLEFMTKLGTRAGMAVGSTEGGEDVMSGLVSLTDQIPKIFGEGNLSSTELRKEFGSGLDQVLGELAQGDVSDAVTTTINNSLSFLEKSFEGMAERLDKSIEDVIANTNNPAILAGKGTAYGIGETIDDLIGTNLVTDDMKNKQRLNFEKSRLGDDLGYVIKNEKEEKITKSEINYNGKLDINFSVPPGFTEEQWKTVTDKLLKDPTFIEKVILLSNNPNGDKNNSEMDKEIKSVLK
jgi:hypothetical protein